MRLLLVVLAFAAAGPSAGLQRVSGDGNLLCWEAPNFLGLELSYEKCCLSQEGQEDECFRNLGGWYNFEYCCYPEPRGCDWEAIASHLEHAEDASQAGVLQIFPVVLREFCCHFPGKAGEHHPCWEAFGPDGNAGQEALPDAAIRCCFPALQRQLEAAAASRKSDSQQPKSAPVLAALEAQGGPAAPAPGPDVEATLPTWLGRELEREFAALRGWRWGVEDFDTFEERLRARGPGNWPCRLRVRRGREVSLCDLQMFCALQPDNDPEWANNDCSYVLAVRGALQILGTLRPLPDMDLFVTPHNAAFEAFGLPVFARHRPREPRGHYLLLPAEWQLHPWQMPKLTVRAAREAARLSWDDRIPHLFWRGTNSNCQPSCVPAKAGRGEVPVASCLPPADCDTKWTWSNWLNMPRGRLVSMTQVFDFIDARWTGLSQEMEPSLWQYMLDNNLTAEHASPTDQARWRFSLNADGTGNGDRILWQMLTESVVFVLDSPLVSWLVGDVGSTNLSALNAYEHYVPLRYDLSDLVENLFWLRSNDTAARRIATAGRRFATRHLSYDGVLLYVDSMVRRYAAEHLTGIWPP